MGQRFSYFLLRIFTKEVVDELKNGGQWSDSNMGMEYFSVKKMRGKDLCFIEKKLKRSAGCDGKGVTSDLVEVIVTDS